MSLYATVERIEGLNVHLVGREKPLTVRGSEPWKLKKLSAGVRRRFVYDDQGVIKGSFELSEGEINRTDAQLNEMNRVTAYKGRNGTPAPAAATGAPAGQVPPQEQKAPPVAPSGPAAGTPEGKPKEDFQTGATLLAEALKRDGIDPAELAKIRDTIKAITQASIPVLQHLHRYEAPLMTAFAGRLNGADLDQRAQIQCLPPVNPTRAELLMMASGSDNYWRAKLMFEIQNSERIGWQGLMNTAAHIAVHATPPHSMKPEDLRAEVVRIARALAADIDDLQHNGVPPRYTKVGE